MLDQNFFDQYDLDEIRAKLAEKDKEIEFLKDHLTKISEKISQGDEAYNFAIGIRVLMLHYGGSLTPINLDDVQKAEFLKAILKTEGSENIRIDLSAINSRMMKNKFLASLFTVRALDQVYEFFEKIEYIEAAKKVDADRALLKGTLNLSVQK